MALLREWLLRALLMIAGPLAFFGLVEGGLRVVGLGYPPSFFVRTGDGWATNEKFGWRLFPRVVARTPDPGVLPDADQRRRVFVLGESAAMGFPDPAFGLPAYLQAALGSDWRVVNAAMTAINSHIVREIALEAARLRPAVFVVYMGNNEVIGPYGAASVFGNFSGNLALIRAQLWTSGLRAGQLFMRPQGQMTEWRGLESFVNAQMAADDPRMTRVYHHFRDNLRLIVRSGRKAGAKVILSTVAVNLKDCPPFASPDGRALQAYAREAYGEARDLDALRFRADSKINGMIREVARDENTMLYDAEREIEATAENFWEHVHLRPKANRRLAEGMAATIAGSARPAGLHVTAWDEYRLARTVMNVVERPPFTAAHREKLRLPPAASAASARGEWEQRVQQSPDDLVARERLAELYAEMKNFAAAESAYRGLLQKMELRSWHTGLGDAVLNQGRAADAERSFQDALRIDDQFAPAYVGLGVVHAMQNRMGAAAADLRRAVAIQPWLAEAHNNLARVLQAQGRTLDAVAEYRAAIAAKPDFAMAHYSLAGLLKPDEARKELEAAVRIDPGFAAAHYDLGVVLASMKRFDEAIAEYAESLRLNPNNADALNNWGTALAHQNRMAEARKKFEAALAIDPRHAAARRNLSAAAQ